MKVANPVEIIGREEEDVAQFWVTVRGAPEWETPGTELASRLKAIDEVLAVFENPMPDLIGLSVFLSDDPEKVLDAVFEAEQSVYALFSHTRLDLRVTRVGGDWDPARVPPNSLARFRRR